MPRTHKENHLVARIGWLRAAVMGANDGIVSTASLIVGVAAAAASQADVLLAGAAGLVAGAMSMAAGEYVSVSSQADTEAADIARETAELAETPEAELHELAGIYQGRGLDRDLAMQVAVALTAHDALGAHLRDELEMARVSTAQPVQAAVTSAITFALGAALPLALAALVPLAWTIPAVAAATLVALALLGALGAQAGGTGLLRPTLRVVFWGAAAVTVTALVGRLVGAAV